MSHDHKSINAHNISITLYPDSGPKKLKASELAALRKKYKFSLNL